MQSFRTLQQSLLGDLGTARKKINYQQNSAHAGGVLAPGAAHARLSARPPIDRSRNFPLRMFAESASHISPNPAEVISEVSEP
jgi:hypothetical protein